MNKSTEIKKKEKEKAVKYQQKIARIKNKIVQGCTKEAINGFGLFAIIFSQTGQMHKDIKCLFLEQIRLQLQLVEGEVKKIKGSSNYESLRP